MPSIGGISLQQSQDIGEVSAAMSALMGCLHAESESSLHQPLDHWGSWLDAEGFNAASLAAWVCELTDSLEAGFSSEQLQAFYSAGLAHGIATGAFLDALTDGAPGYVEAMQARIDALLAADEQARQLAGGKGLDVRPAYLASGATLIAFGIACKKGYVTRAYTWTKEAVGDLWTSIRTTTRDVRTTAQDDLMRDRLHPVDVIRQAEVVAPEVPMIELNVARLEESTLVQIKGAAATYAKNDVESLFAEEFPTIGRRINMIPGSDEEIEVFGNYDTIKNLVDTTVRIDRAGYNELRAAYETAYRAGFEDTTLYRRFQDLRTPAADSMWEREYSRFGPRLPSDACWGPMKAEMEKALQASYEKVLFDEVKAARAVAAQDVIVVEQTKADFEASVKQKAFNECSAVRSAAIEEFKRDMEVAKDVMLREGKSFVDIEEQAALDFEEGAANDAARLE